ncbi:hypothetical protein TTHERM_000311961 (macronuclear) [Tetrahymena thermophila SB210]|uniref:Uncharacterized protein n=1 Tax=Tetrahymena thermophila (strain SB210) TaxID=312017 RepID=W7XGW0_TETTS|nr:hypothetical protein TTHERM_000311961 [Tetrahymena thermophila SB210]EWS72229.1 hypothetical protein TTHERM_000311961 [Tetrahymena thermophila SB210]|eukprot:XP_012655169.1 hypothetical protein TTHERM_000311961 [Tetrahymena thermophila SB210]
MQENTPVSFIHIEQALERNKNDSKSNKLQKQLLILNQSQNKTQKFSIKQNCNTFKQFKNIIKKNGTIQQDLKLLGGGSCLSCNCNNNFQEIKQADIEDIEDLNNDSIIFCKYEEEKEETKYDQINYFNEQYSKFIQSQRMQKVMSENSYLNEVYLILNEFIYSNINLIMQNIDEFKVYIIDMLELLIYYIMCSQLLSSISNQKQNLQINQTIQNSINSIINYISKIDFDYPCLDVSFMLNLIKQLVESNSSALDFSKEDQFKIYLINTLLEKGLSGDSNEFTKNLADRFTQNTEIYAQLQDFINSIQPKDQHIINKYQEIVIQIKHPEFRFLSIQILLKLINIINYIDYQQSETVLIHLCTQYLCENDQSVKIVFKNNFKLQSFLRRIKNNKNAQQRVRDCTIQKRKQLTVITEVDEQINEK